MSMSYYNNSYTLLRRVGLMFASLVFLTLGSDFCSLIFLVNSLSVSHQSKTHSDSLTLSTSKGPLDVINSHDIYADTEAADGDTESKSASESSESQSDSESDDGCDCIDGKSDDPSCDCSDESETAMLKKSKTKTSEQKSTKADNDSFEESESDSETSKLDTTDDNTEKPPAPGPGPTTVPIPKNNAKDDTKKDHRSNVDSDMIEELRLKAKKHVEKVENGVSSDSSLSKSKTKKQLKDTTDSSKQLAHQAKFLNTGHSELDSSHPQPSKVVPQVTAIAKSTKHKISKENNLKLNADAPGDVLNPNAPTGPTPTAPAPPAAPAAPAAPTPPPAAPGATTTTTTVTLDPIIGSYAPGSVEALQLQLDSVQDRLARLRAEIALWSDHDTWNQKMIVDKKAVSDETKSPALGDMLADIRYELHQLAVPVFVEVLTDKIEILMKEEKDLMKKLAAAKAERAKQTESAKAASESDNSSSFTQGKVSLLVILLPLIGALIAVGCYIGFQRVSTR